MHSKATAADRVRR